MTEWKQKRFWKAAVVAAVEDGFGILLDGRPVKTPAKEGLVVPTRVLAEAIAAEWEAQSELIAPLTMPFTRSANAAIDKARPQQDEVCDLIADYGGTDLLCYRAEAPEELVARQAAAWDPFLAWADTTFDARLNVAAGVMYVAQDDAALANLRAPIVKMNCFELAAMHDLVSLTGSLVLGLAATRDYAEPAEIWTASRIDEIWQAEQWGLDEEAAEVAKHREQAFFHAKAFFDACG